VWVSNERLLAVRDAELALATLCVLVSNVDEEVITGGVATVIDTPLLVGVSLAEKVAVMLLIASTVLFLLLQGSQRELKSSVCF
jgi:hypothetical protein